MDFWLLWGVPLSLLLIAPRQQRETHPQEQHPAFA